MGLSSSQARLLNLTGRMHQIEYKAAKLEAQKLQMANESARVYQDYQDALEKTKVQIKTLNTDGSATYKDINSLTEMQSAGFTIVIHDVPVGTDGKTPAATVGTDKKVTKSASTQTADIVIKTTTSGSNTVADTGTLQRALAAKYGTYVDTNVTGAKFESLLTNLIGMGDVSFVQKKGNSFPDATAADFADYQTSVATNTSFQEVTDESDLRKAEAKYEADMKRIDNKDKKYDYDLAALDNERNAIKQEMDTLKTVSRDNVDRTFKLFS